MALFTPEELEALRLADEEIDEDFRQTQAEIEASRRRDRKVNIGEGITFATIQTMCRLDLSQYKHYWDVIIVDECHRCSGTPTAMTQFSKVLSSLSARHKYGLSATVHRSDGTIAATYMRKRRAAQRAAAAT